MSMSKQDFVALADMIKSLQNSEDRERFRPGQIAILADFCRSQNSNFKRERWLEYIAGKCGPNGGAIKRT